MDDTVKTDATLTWKATLILVALVLSLPAIFPLAMFAWERYQFKIQWQIYYQQNAAADFKTFNDLCTTYTELATEQKWYGTARQWSELCRDHVERHFAEFYE